MIGKKWGLGPKQAYWLYTAIVRPMLLYGLLIWIAGVKGAVIKKDLVQRLACLMIARVMRSTPTAGIEAIPRTRTTRNCSHGECKHKNEKLEAGKEKMKLTFFGLSWTSWNFVVLG